MNPKHIIFDCDGVLIDTEIVAAEVVTDWLHTEKVDITVEEFIHTHTGKLFRNILKELMEAGSLRKDLHIPSVMVELDKQVRDNMRIIDGVLPMLNSIGLPKSVVSNSDVDYVEEALKKFGLAPHFGAPVFSAEMVAEGKPSPMVYQLAIDTIGVDEASIIAIEDSYTGVQAATRAGIPTIGFLGGSHIRDGHAERLQSLGVIGLASNHQELGALLSQS